MAEQKNAQNVDVNQLLKVRREKLQDLQERGKDPFQITKYDMTHHSMEIKDNFDELEGKTVSIAGRMMFKRVMGKASFCNIQDLQGSIQSYVARDNIGEESYADFKKYDVGDILGIKGEVFKTKTGEISIHDQVYISLTITGICVSQTMEFLRQNLKALGKKCNFCRMNRNLTCFCLEYFTFDTENITYIIFPMNLR